MGWEVVKEKGKRWFLENSIVIMVVASHVIPLSFQPYIFFSGRCTMYKKKAGRGEGKEKNSVKYALLALWRTNEPFHFNDYPPLHSAADALFIVHQLADSVGKHHHCIIACCLPGEDAIPHCTCAWLSMGGCSLCTRGGKH